MYGGWSLLEGTRTSQVYVLTIPSFRWILVSDEGNLDLLIDPDVGRSHMSCEIWNGTQMLVAGGHVSSGSVIYNNVCNNTYLPFKVLDTSNYMWQTQFIPNKTYTVPNVVYKVIGGGYVSKSLLY